MEHDEKSGGPGAEISHEEASAVIKRYAEDQKITVELSGEQLDAILGQWKSMDRGRPAQITFYVENRPVGELRVATCAYWSDTCCA